MLIVRVTPYLLKGIPHPWKVAKTPGINKLLR